MPPWRKPCAPAAWRRNALREAGHLLGGPDAGRQAGRPAGRRGLAHAGFGQKFFDALLRRARSSVDPAMQNPTLVLDRPQRFGRPTFRQFQRCHELLRQMPVQAENREHLRELLKVASGGVVFTTIQKFFPEKGEKHASLLSDRRNIVVIADEAHRSQYDLIDGFARHMRDALPNASFIGFTGTPIEKNGCQHAGRFRRLHFHLRHPARRGRQGHRADLLREPLAKLELKPGGTPED
jgi:type I restriction enzyme R subunit